MIPIPKLFLTVVFLLQISILLDLKSQTLPGWDSSSGLTTATLKLSTRDTSYQLAHEFIVGGSEILLLDSLRKLEPNSDYVMDYRNGIVSFRGDLLRQILSDSASHQVHLSFRILPLAFKREYFLRQVVVRKDTLGKNRLSVSQPSRAFSADEYFGANLQKSGSLARGFTVGTNRDLALNSGLRMQLSGKLSPDVDVVAALTDENSPIQPEGTTQSLRDVDKVFIELKSSQFGVTLGDFNAEVTQREGGEFARHQRKLQGAKATASFGSLSSIAEKTNIGLIAATSRGKFHTNQFQGVEGNQGPYRLTGRNGEQRLIVVAGSERVYLNGELMTRGEINDYTVDYSSGEVIFTSRRLITSSSRVTVDFEYTDRQFTRNYVSGSTNAEGFSNSLNVNAVFVQEADDPAAPVDIPLDETSRDILRQSGNDRFKASFSGIRFVGVDSLTQAGKGQYKLTDSTINGKQYTVLRYAPGDSLSLYAVTFSQVDRVPRDSAGYIRVGIGHFQFAGLGAGNYMPLQFLPMPQLQRTIGVNAQARVTPEITFSGEYAASRIDRNRLSDIDDADNDGVAFKFAGRFNQKQVSVGGTNLGEIDMSLSERFIDRRFVSPDRFQEVEFNRAWNLESSSAANEEIREAYVTYRPIPLLSVGGLYGFLDRQGQSQSTRIRSQVSLTEPSLPILTYHFEDIRNSNFSLNTNSAWVRQRGDLDYLISSLKPGFGVEMETRKTHPSNSDSLLQGSFGFLQIAPRIGLPELGKMSASAEIQIRAEDSAANGSLEKAFTALTQTYTWQLREWKSLSGNITLNLRKTRFEEEFKKRGNTDSEVILVRSTSRYTPFQRAADAEAYYEFASQRSARLERAFVRVARGSGNYQYNGDVNGNGIADEEEFSPTRFDGDFIAVYIPSDQLYPVVDLKTSFRLKLQPARVIGIGASGLEKVMRVVSTESFVRIDEKSREPDASQIYLLNFKRFQNEATTIAGSNQFTQDLFLFENSPELSFRFRYAERSGLLQLVSATERNYQKERSVRIRSQLVRELGNQTDYSNRIDRVTSTVLSFRVRDLTVDALTSEFSYRPELQWEVGFTVGFSRIVDYYTASKASADINEQGLRMVYALLGAGQFRSEFRREEVTLSNVDPDPLRPLPYEFTGGKATGKSFLWQLAFDYRISQNVQVTVNYNGRSERGRPAIHVARAEARAFF
ncbi:MAG: hypothetical protein HYY49_09005 [Ignavibacteriales bacterium]|nr:hypothetical protein [Ignavibacteriales bacterium]